MITEGENLIAEKFGREDAERDFKNGIKRKYVRGRRFQQNYWESYNTWWEYLESIKNTALRKNYVEFYKILNKI